MANPILLKYFKDSSVPEEKRKAALEKLKSGAVSEGTLLEAVKKGYAQKGIALGSATIQSSPGSEPGFGERLATNVKRAFDPTDPQGYFQSAFVPAAEATVGPVGRTVAAPIVGAYKAGEQAITGQGQAEPVNVPLLGNINPYRADETGEVSAGETAKNLAGMVIESGATLASVANPAMGVGRAAVTGSAIGAGAEMQRPESTAGSIAFAGAVGGAAGAVFQKLLGAKAPADSKAIMEEAKSYGINPSHYNMALHLSPEEKIIQKQFLETAIESAVDSKVKSPTQLVADDNLVTGLRKLQDITKGKGRQIGEIKGDTIRTATSAANDITPIVTTFESKLKDKGVQFTKEGLDFTKSSFAGSPGDEKLLGEIWSEVSSKKLSDSRITTLVDQIDNLTKIGKVAGKDIGAAKAFVVDVRASLKDVLHEKNPTLKELDSVFSEIKRIVTSGKKATKSTVPALEIKDISGENAWNFLRKSTGSGSRQNLSLLKKIEEVGTKYKVPELQGLEKLSQMARAAEDVIQLDVNRSTALAGQTAQAAQVVQAAAPGGAVLKVLDSVARFIPTKTAYDRFEKLLTEPGHVARVAEIAAQKLNKVPGMKETKGLQMPTFIGAFSEALEDFIFGGEAI